MKKIFYLVTFSAMAILAGCSSSSDSSDAADKQSPSTQEQTQQTATQTTENTSAASWSDDQKQAYSIGLTVSQELKQTLPNLDIAVFKQALDDVYLNHSYALSTDQVQTELTKLQQQQMMEMQNKQEKAAAENEKQGQQFLQDNAKKEGVKTTASGLQYKIIKSGTGPQPRNGDDVTVNYEGRLINGTVVDSSYQRGQPATFNIDNIIPGWQEALKMMHQGDEWMIYIPANLAYQSEGRGPIGPNETLIFKVELQKVSAKNASNSAQ